MSTYCVVLRPQPSLKPVYRHARRYYLRAESAAEAILIASDDPEWPVIGVEPRDMFDPSHKVVVQALPKIDPPRM
jgi:hypothetical protein